MSSSILISIVISAVTFTIFFILQMRFNAEVGRKRQKFINLFKDGNKGYKIRKTEPITSLGHLEEETEDLTSSENNTSQIDASSSTSKNDSDISQIDMKDFPLDSDLGKLIREINEYIRKTKGTTEFSIIQNKTERLEEMLYEDSTARMSFPIYLGLMGTFCGVFLGILSFLVNVWTGSVNDDSIKGLLLGVLVSMSTSFIGLLLTTRNNYYCSDAKRKVDIDKNKFFDFIQTELMPSLDISMVSALNKLHDTVVMFEPSFNRVITNFQETFDDCTETFGEQFTRNVAVVSRAVDTMGNNMDKINENIDLQTKLIRALGGNKIVKGLDAFMTAADHFNQITESLERFEQICEIMLGAAQDVVDIQKESTKALQKPNMLLNKVNNILDRITTFEENINKVGESLAQTQMVGNHVINIIDEQLKAIQKKNDIAGEYMDIAESKLRDMYSRQVTAIEKITQNYEIAIKEHIAGFNSIIEDSTKDFQKRHEEFKSALDEKFNIGEVHEDFSNLKKLDNIDKQIQQLVKDPTLTKIQQSLTEFNGLLKTIRESKQDKKGILKNIFTKRDKNEGRQK